MPVSPYTRERLEAAVTSSRTLPEALGKLGVDPKGAKRNYLRERMEKLGVDTSHFEREGGKWTRERLQARPAHARRVADRGRCVVLPRRGATPPGPAEQRRTTRPTAHVDRRGRLHHHALPGPGTPAGQAGNERQTAGRRAGTAQRPASDRNQAPAPRASRSRRAGPVRQVWRRARVAGQTHVVGGRSHQRGLARQPAGEPSVAVPQLPRGHEHVVQGRQKAADDSRYDGRQLAAVAQRRRSRLRICGP